MGGDIDFLLLLAKPATVGLRRPEMALFCGNRLMREGNKVVEVEVLVLLVAAAKLGSLAGANREELTVGVGDSAVA
jgi:hypothetical protein